MNRISTAQAEVWSLGFRTVRFREHYQYRHCILRYRHLRDRMQFALSQLAAFEEGNLETWVVGFHTPQRKYLLSLVQRYCIKPIQNAQVLFFFLFSAMMASTCPYWVLKLSEHWTVCAGFLGPVAILPLPPSLHPCPVHRCDSVSFPAPFPSTPLSFLSLTFEEGRYDFGCRHSQIYGSSVSSVTEEMG